MLETAPSTVNPACRPPSNACPNRRTRRPHSSPATAAQIREELVLQGRLLLYLLRRCGGLTGGLQHISILH